MRILVCAAAALGVWGAWRGYRRAAFAVAGASMSPTLEAGDFVLLDWRGSPAVGDVVVATRPDAPGIEIVKRVRAITADGALYVVGDNEAASTDSRSFGAVPASNVVGVVRLCYWPPGRWRRL